MIHRNRAGPRGDFEAIGRAEFLHAKAFDKPLREEPCEPGFDMIREFRYSGSMSEMAADAWFYTREGEKIGPVTLSDLRIKASEGALNPRLDMVWTQGMDGWKASGEIEGLFERSAAPQVPVELAPAADPYRPPGQGTAAEMMNHQGDWPGARRRSFFFMTCLFPSLWILGLAAATPFLASKLGDRITAFVPLVAMLVLVVAVLYFAVRRLINLGMSGWWIIGSFVPFLNVWVNYRCFACPGGYAYHKKLDGVGVFLAIVYWLVLVSLIGSIGYTGGVLLGKIGTPELQQQVREAYEKGAEQARQRIEESHRK